MKRGVLQVLTTEAARSILKLNKSSTDAYMGYGIIPSLIENTRLIYPVPQGVLTRHETYTIKQTPTVNTCKNETLKFEKYEFGNDARSL